MKKKLGSGCRKKEWWDNITPEQAEHFIKAMQKWRSNLSPEEKNEIAERRSRGIKRRWKEDEEWAEQQRIKLRENIASISDEERKRRSEKCRLTLEKYWSNPKNKARHRKLIRSKTSVISATLKGKKKPPRTKKHKVNISAAMRKVWADRKASGEDRTIAKKIAQTLRERLESDPELKGKLIKQFLEGARICGGLKPNYAEKKLKLILDKNFPKEFKINVDGRVIIANKIPDFINVNGKKAIVELFGSYWHEPSEEASRKKLFSEYGFRTAIIWEKDLKNENVVVKKVKKVLK